MPCGPGGKLPGRPAAAGTCANMTENMTTAEATRRQLVAHDILAQLIALNGVDSVTHFLRYWYVVTSLEGKRRRSTGWRTRPSGQ